MKIRVKQTGNVFHVPFEVGHLLLSLGTDKLEEAKDPVAPVDRAVKWTVFGTTTSLSIPGIKGDCPVCHQGITMTEVRPFMHCNGADLPPEDIEASWRALVKRRKPAKPVQHEGVPGAAEDLANVIGSF